MWVLFVFAAFLTLFVANSGVYEYQQREVTLEARQSEALNANFKAFSMAAQMHAYGTALAAGAYYWDDIKNNPRIPPAIRNANISPDWKMVADGMGGFVICAQMPESAVRRLMEIMPDEAQPMRTTSGNVALSDSAANAQSEAAKCGVS